MTPETYLVFDPILQELREIKELLSTLASPPKPRDPEGRYTIKEAAIYLGVSTATIRDWAKSGKLEALPFNEDLERKHYRFTQQALDTKRDAMAKTRQEIQELGARRVYARRYREKTRKRDPEKMREYNRRYRAKHRDKILADARKRRAEYRKHNPEEAREKGRQYARNYRAKHRDKVLADARKYREEHREQIRAYHKGYIAAKRKKGQ